MAPGQHIGAFRKGDEMIGFDENSLVNPNFSVLGTRLVEVMPISEFLEPM